jgi:beta-glucanase (GH16 family)
MSLLRPSTATTTLAPLLVLIAACAAPEPDAGEAGQMMGAEGWEVDFMDDFDSFDPANWQDQSIWTNDEQHCYVANGEHGTREVSDGTLKIRVVDLGEPVACDSYSKTGEQHPPTPWVAARIISKNRQEFIKGRWTARLRVPNSGEAGMFPAWWLLGAQNNEPPNEDPDETVCWPMTGS